MFVGSYNDVQAAICCVLAQSINKFTKIFEKLTDSIKNHSAVTIQNCPKNPMYMYIHYHEDYDLLKC